MFKIFSNNNYFKNKNIINILFFLLLAITINNNIYSQNDLKSALKLQFSSQDNQPSVQEAFTINAYIKNNNQIVINTSTLANTYLYANSFKFNPNNKKIILYTPQLPDSKTVVDEHYGKTKIYQGDNEIIIPYQAKQKLDFILTIDYQGCLENILCYPPQSLKFNLTALASSGDAIPKLKPMEEITSIAETNSAIDLLNGASVAKIILGFTVFGLLLSLTPCVLPMLPIISGIIAGHKNTITKQQAFILSFVYVLSMAITFMIAGILVAAAGVNLVRSMQHPLVITIVSVIFLLLALASFGLFELKLPDSFVQKLNNVQQHQKGGTYIGVTVMGCLSALVISPCATAPLAGALLYISSTGNILLGAVALFSMGFAMGVPVLLFGTSAGHFIPKAGPWMREVNILFGVIFIAMALFLLSRLPIITGPMILILTAFLLIFYAVHLGLLEPAKQGWQRIQKAAALVMAIYGCFLLAGATQNKSDIFHPFGIIPTLTNSSSSDININNKSEYLDFTTIHNLQELINSLEQAKKSNKYTILEFSADWCTYCREIETKVFTDSNVYTKLSNFNRIKVDLTHASSEDTQILNKYKVFNPPTIMFFNPEGQEVENSRVTSLIKAESLLKLLKSFN